MGDMDTGFGAALGNDIRDKRMSGEGGNDFLWFAGGDEEVEVVNDFLAAAIAAADFNLSGGGVGGEEFAKLLGDRVDKIEAELGGVGFAKGDALENLVDAFLTEARQGGGCAGFTDAFEVSEAGNAEVGVKALYLFGTEALDFEQFEKGVGELGFEFVVEGQSTGGGEFMKLILEGVTEAFDALELVVSGELHDVPGKGFNKLGAGFVGADFEGVFAFEFEEEGDSGEDFGSGFAGHGALGRMKGIAETNGFLGENRRVNGSSPKEDEKQARGF